MAKKIMCPRCHGQGREGTTGQQVEALMFGTGPAVNPCKECKGAGVVKAPAESDGKS